MGEEIDFTVNRIDDPQDLRLKEFSERRDSLLRQNQVMIVDSDKVVSRMIKGGYRIKRLLATERFLRILQAGELRLAPDVEVFLGDKPVVEQIIGHRIHHGVVAIAERPEDCSLDALGDRLVILNGVVSSENVGAIVRCCHAFGFSGLIADQLSCTPWVRRAIRVSMGSVFSLNIYHTDKLLELMSKLKGQGYALYGSGIVPHSISSKGFLPNNRFALILGSEGAGMQQAVIDACDVVLQIPVDAGIDSLNVAVASGVLLYQLGCQS